MALNFHPRLLIILALLVVAHSLSPRIYDGFCPVPPDDPHVIVIAKFAVHEYNQKNNASLVFKTVLSAEKQIVSGANYRIFLTAKDGDSISTYSTLVNEDIYGQKTLKEFSPSTHPYLPPNDPHVIEIAKFAVDNRNQIADSNLVFETVLRAEILLLTKPRIVLGTSYSVLLTAKDGNVEAKFSAIVHENPSGQKCLEKFSSYTC